ncbi:hypothetical protein Q3W71_24780 [Micromonospora sp. C28SCA-DRY-2]|uniref:hypothetical protein n=1 Tax=Micromonospora sp. C28SCA-DRY-2 TaxID=3059522 RepID=UPI0026745D37|nr:hypothetical protein [Micromonospora sp. C28SCA-DRY-2]MDO3704886.1 hypothetical protein [Micromonospora sp. C28SCA-DRY-2]
MSTPMSNDQRQPIYLRQSGRKQLTPRQRRRVEHKQGRIERLGMLRTDARRPGR